jgi:hypothetical protein
MSRPPDEGWTITDIPCFFCASVPTAVDPKADQWWCGRCQRVWTGFDVVAARRWR